MKKIGKKTLKNLLIKLFVVFIVFSMIIAGFIVLFQGF